MDTKLQFDPRGRITLYLAFFELGLRLFPDEWTGREIRAQFDPTQEEYETRRADVIETLASLEQLYIDSLAFDASEASNADIQLHSKHVRTLLYRRAELRVERDTLNEEFDARLRSVDEYGRKLQTLKRLREALSDGDLCLYADEIGFLQPRDFREAKYVGLDCYTSIVTLDEKNMATRSGIGFFKEGEFNAWIEKLEKLELHIIRTEGAETYQRMCEWMGRQILLNAPELTKADRRAAFENEFQPKQKQTFDKLWEIFATRDWSSPGRRKISD